MVAQGTENLVAPHGAPQLGACEAPAGHNEPITFYGFLSRGNEKALLGFSYFFRFKPQPHRDIGSVQPKPEHIHYGVCLVGVGVHPAGLLRHGVKAQGAEPL